MNVFEGSRRLALLLALVVGSGTLIHAATYDPFVRVSYLISDPNVGFTRLDGPCPPGLVRDSATQTQDEIQLFLEFCVLKIPDLENPGPSRVTGGGAQGVPSHPADRYAGLERARANALRNARLRLAYRRAVDSGFVIPGADHSWIREQASRRYWRNWWESLMSLAFGLAFFGALVWAVGWVARGFIGIPRGIDWKPDRSTRNSG
jgi:hypothetical protein